MGYRLSVSIHMLLTIFVLFFSSISLVAQSVIEKDLEQAYLFQDRIGRSLAFDIIQDQQGVMWFANVYGLIKYDGTSTRYYQTIPGDSTSISGDITNCLFEDPNGSIWVGTQNSGLNILHRNSDQFSRYQHQALDPTSLPANRVNDMLIDSLGRIWIATQAGGLSIFDRQKKQFLPQDGPTDLMTTIVNQLYIDSRNRLWAATEKGLFYADLTAEKIIFHPLRSNNKHQMNITCLLEDRSGRFWIGTREDGLFRLEGSEQELVPVRLLSEAASYDPVDVWQIYEGRRGTIWIATFRGLFYITEQTGTQGFDYQPKQFTLGGIRKACSVFESEDGVLWVGTNSSVRVFAPKHKVFHFYPGLMVGETRNKGKGVTTIARSHTDQIWTPTLHGLLQFDPKARIFHQDFLKKYPELRYFDEHNIKAFHQDTQGRLWISIVAGFNANFGLFSYDLATGKLSNHSIDIPAFGSHLTWNIEEDEEGTIWFANENGLVSFHSNSNSFQSYLALPEAASSLPTKRLNKIFPTKNGKLWAGTRDNGLFELDADAQLLQHFTPVPGDTFSLGNLRVRDIFEDTQKRMWLGTSGGLNLFLPEEGKFRQYHKQHGLKENAIMNVLEDQQGNIWLSTHHYVVFFDPASDSFIHYGKKDGMDLNDIWDNAAYLGPSGHIFLGGDEGLLMFHPDDIKTNHYRPSVILTDFLLFNKHLQIDPEEGPLKTAIERVQQIVLNHDQDVFTLHFSALSYINSENNQYAYQLEGFDRGWQFIDNRTETTYTNLPSGTYTFQVKATNNDGLWGPVNDQLSIVILPPWYGSNWAKSIWLTLLILGIFLIYKFLLSRQLEKAENKHLLELNQLKSKFYTNITHEFRTPLTVILGMADKVKEQPGQWLKEGVQMIQNNGRQLLGLINQILDLSKLESRSLPINWVNGNIIEFLAYLSESFQSFAETRGIGLHFQTTTKEVIMDYDTEKTHSILTNIISNAIKYAGEGGQVFIQVEQKMIEPVPMLSIKIKDTGKGIPSSALPYVFDRFYQVNGDDHSQESTGIGLALSKQLVELLGGSITVISEVDQGSVFTISLPIFNKSVEKAPVSDHQAIAPVILPVEVTFSDIPYKPISGSLEKAPRILIVEDNQDVATYLRSCLADSYETLVAINGLDGCEEAIRSIPDLIISDVMMPKRNGFELCEILKQDQRSSHIPIILLTAKADFESKLSGLDLGADAYMPKPFHRQELLIRIENLLESRRRLQTYYLSRQNWQEEQQQNKEGTDREDSFLALTRSLIEKGLDQGEYSVEQLAKALNMSSSQLYRKITALTGRSPIKLLRHIQISRSKELLINSELSISEIAYQTGFNDPAYFTRVFSAETGLNPSAFRENLP